MRNLTVKTLATSLILMICGLFSVPAQLLAAPPELSFPLKCTLGESCWLVNFVDRDPGPGYTDFECGAFSYNTHKGTDIAIADDAQMRRGVAVLAAASAAAVVTAPTVAIGAAPVVAVSAFAISLVAAAPPPTSPPQQR